MSARHSPVPAYFAAIAGIALFSIMDMVMKGLAIAIGTYSTLLWRSLVGIGLAAIPYVATRRGWPGPAEARHQWQKSVIPQLAELRPWQAQSSI